MDRGWRQSSEVHQEAGIERGLGRRSRSTVDGFRFQVERVEKCKGRTISTGVEVPR